MATRLAIVASDFPVWREMVQDAGCGLCVNPRDPKAIARAVDTLASDPKRLASMGELGRKLFEERYNWPIEEEKLFEVYSMLGRPGRRNAQS